jgi:asparagine synthase (glutamine-hydrolysing)
MCGIAGIFGSEWKPEQVCAMVRAQAHRGPDDSGYYFDARQTAGMGHARLSIIDLSCLGRQPMSSMDGRYWVSFNGEIYNYLELRRELADYPYRSRSDTELILAAFMRWGPACLDRFLGMFAILLWDAREQCLFAARDRFGVKPFFYHHSTNGSLHVASEIKALHAAGISRVDDDATWASYLCYGTHAPEQTFWKGIRALPAGHALTWRQGRLKVTRWYDPAERTCMQYDTRPLNEVTEEYTSLLHESVRLRFRSDVAVGVSLSGGVDSSVLFALLRQPAFVQSSLKTFTFVTGDPRYDELPWVEQMLRGSAHRSSIARLTVDEVPALAEKVQFFQD